MPPQKQLFSPTPPLVGVEVVTLTVYSSGSSTQSGLPPLTSGGGSSVPVAAIAGGAAGGVAIAVLLVIIWKHWGRVIKRTEKHRRKEVQDILTVRENTRRNAASGFKPQSQYRPMSTLNPESRKVTFLTRSPTFQRGTSKLNNSVTAEALKPTDEERGEFEEPPPPPAPSSAASADARDADLGSESIEPRVQSSASLSALPPGAAQPLRLPVREAVAEPVRRQSESGEWTLEWEENALSRTESGSVLPPRLGRAASPTPSGSTSRRAPSPTPSRNTSRRTSTSAPKPSRSVRMRTPRRLPDPPPMFVGRDHSSSRPPSPTPSAPGSSSSRPPSIISNRAYETPTMPRNTPPISIVPPVPPIPAAEESSPSSSTTSWTRSPLRNSVLASDQPVIMPRPKNTRSSESQPVSPTSTWGHAPSLSGSYAYLASAESGEAQSRLVGSRRGRLSVGMASRNQRTVSTQSSISVYSNDSFGHAGER